MYSRLMTCTKCDLRENQMPLVDKKRKADVMWVGLSAKKVVDIETDIPLSCTTNSGKIISQIESNLDEINYYKTNLVKCVPLDEQGKLRYPDKKEMQLCFNNLLYEINLLAPKIVFLLGKEVSSFVFRNYGLDLHKLDEDYNYKTYMVNNMFFVPVHHPSFITVYRRKRKDDYANSIKDIIYNTITVDCSCGEIAI